MTSKLTIHEPQSIVTGSRGIKLNSLDELMRFCQIVVASKLAPKGLDTPEAVFVAVQAGLEIGLSPIQALQSIAVINGKPTLYGDAALALIIHRRNCIDIEETFEGSGEEGEAICKVERKGKSIVIRCFGYKDAKRASLWGKSGPWVLYPKRMLQMRARAWALRDAFPDVLRGIGVFEEQYDIPTAEVQNSKNYDINKEKKLIFPDEEDSKFAEIDAHKKELAEVSAGNKVNAKGEFIF